MAFKHVLLLWNAKDVIMGHEGDTAFLSGHKKTYYHIRGTRWSCL